MTNSKTNPLLNKYQQLLSKKEKDFVQSYLNFLKFKSISTQEQYKQDVSNCAQWVKERLENLHFDTEIWETSGHPAVFAQNLKAGPDKPTLLMYQHYDVQPVDPVDEWNSSPFEPTLDKDEVYARGACDNKGQAFYVLMALEMVYENLGHYPLNIKVVIEGEEECGSKGLTELLSIKKKELQANYLSVVDVDIPAPDVPAINLSARGMVSYTLELTGSNTDLHSGIHGGIVYNPLRALSEALSKCYDAKGKVTIPHFYDGVKEYTEQEKQQIYTEFDVETYRKQYQAEPNGGEQDFTPLERSGMRPTFEINGIWGGYNEKGFKTVIPAKAFAKLSMRLVSEQDPKKIHEQFQKHFKSLLPTGMKVHFKLEGELSQAYTCPFDSKIAQAAIFAYNQVFSDKTCQRVMGGGSLPILRLLKEASNAEVLAFGLGLSTDKIHAPNEHFSISRLKKGSLIVAQFLHKLSEI